MKELGVEKIAERLHTRPARVSKWRQRFMRQGISALSDAPRSGKPARYDSATESAYLMFARSGTARWLLAVERTPVGGKR